MAHFGLDAASPSSEMKACGLVESAVAMHVVPGRQVVAGNAESSDLANNLVGCVFSARTPGPHINARILESGLPGTERKGRDLRPIGRRGTNVLSEDRRTQ